MSGHEYITVRLLNECGNDCPPRLRAILQEAAVVIRGRDEALAARASKAGTTVTCPHCDRVKSDSEMVQAVDNQLNLRREPENEESAGQCTSHSVQHLVDSCIGHRRRIKELEAALNEISELGGAQLDELHTIAMRALGKW